MEMSTAPVNERSKRGTTMAPLKKSASKKAIGENIKTEMARGKSREQSIAIALSVQREAKKKVKK